MASHFTEFEKLVKNNKLDISNKELVTLKGISKCKDITWLDVSSNQLDSLQWVKKLKKIIVLKASNNRLTSIHNILHLENLKALILNNNYLQSADGIEKLMLLNSLVLSHNKLQTIDVSSCKNLTKLSLSHNDFQQFPNMEHLSDLKELRLNDNHIKDIPTSIAPCKKLKLIDLGNNKITSLRFLETLSKTNVENLNLKGNEVCSLPDYREKVLGSLPYLKVLDGRRINSEERRANSVSLSKFEKGSSIQDEDVKSLPTKTSEKSEKSKLDSKNRPAKVGGFISRFPQNTRRPEDTESGSKAKNGSHENSKVRSITKHSTDEVSKQKKRKLEGADNIEYKSRKKGKIKLNDTDVNEASISSHENMGLSKAETDSKGEERQDAEIVEDMFQTLSKSRKRKKNKVREEFHSVTKQKKISKAKKIKGNEDSTTIKFSSSNTLVENARQTADASSVNSSEKDKNREKNSKEERSKKRTAAKQSEHEMKHSRLDKRSGVLGVKVIKRKQRKGASINVEVLEKNQDYEFGVGEGGGW